MKRRTLHRLIAAAARHEGMVYVGMLAALLMNWA